VVAARSSASSGMSKVRTCFSSSSKSSMTADPFSARHSAQYCDSTSARSDLRHTTKRYDASPLLAAWCVEDIGAVFVVKDSNGQQLADAQTGAAMSMPF
jgi:hypothetical protein